MAERLLIVDSDLFILLAAAGVVDRVAGLLGVKPENVRRLVALPAQLTRGKKFLKNYSDAVRQAALHECGRVNAVEGRPADDDRFQRLVDTSDIDEGEALLFALAAEQPALYLASGDKRAMVALGKASALQDVRDALAGRIVCLEAVLKLLVEADGAATTAAAFAAVREGNTTLRVVFSEAGATSQTQCLGYIDAYFDDLVGKVGAPALFFR